MFFGTKSVPKSSDFAEIRNEILTISGHLVCWDIRHTIQNTAKYRKNARETHIQFPHEDSQTSNTTQTHTYSF